MKRTTLVLFMIILFYAKVRSKECSKTERILVSFASPENTKDVTHRTTVQFDKLTYDSSIKARIIRVQWTNVYCPAVEFGPFEDCVEKVVTPHFDKLELDNFHSAGLLPVPGQCGEGSCDGLDEEECLNPPVNYFGTCPMHSYIPLSSSWIHHRCSREISITGDEAMLIQEYLEPTVRKVGGPDLGECVIKKNETACYTNIGILIQIIENKSPIHQRKSFPCIERGEERLCYDSESELQFSVGPGDCKCLVGVTFCEVDIRAHNTGHADGERVITFEVIEEIESQLEFDNLESRFDAVVLLDKVTRLQKMVKSILLFNYKISDDPLQHFLGFGLEPLSWKGESMTANLCTPGSRNHLNSDNGGSPNKTVSLFDPNKGILDYQSFKLGVPFFERPVYPMPKRVKKIKVVHGDSNIVGSVSFLSFDLWERLNKFLDHLVHFLPLFNTMLICLIFRFLKVLPRNI